MAKKMSAAVVQAMLDAFETQLITGGAPKMELRSGAPPANAAASAIGTLIATYTLAADPMANAAGTGTKAFNAITAVNAVANATIGHYRLYKNDGTTCVDQGTVATSAADMIIDNPAVTIGQPINVNSWVLDMSAYI